MWGLVCQAGQCRFGADLAAQWGLPCTLERMDVPALAQAERRSLEDAARRARYWFLHAVAARIGATRIAVGHHADDQVETLVMHWLRGSGLAGLSGMRPLEQKVIRPLLGTSRADILHYCAWHHLPYREDPSNRDRRFLRNRIRHDLLPVLEQYNANLRETLLRNASVLAAEDEYIETQVDACWPAVIREETAEHLVGDVAAYRRLPLVLRRRFVRRLGVRASGGDIHLEMRHIEAIDALLFRSSGSGMLHLPGGLRLCRIYERFIFGFLPERRQQEGAQQKLMQSERSVPLPVPGEGRLPGNPWLVRTRVLARQQTTPPGYEPGNAGRRWGYMDFDTAMKYAPFSLRLRRRGDRFRMLGLRGAKKLQDVLVDAKIPRAERDQLPLVCGVDGTILWVAGYQIADQVKLTPNTQRILALELRTAERSDSAGRDAD